MIKSALRILSLAGLVQAFGRKYDMRAQTKGFYRHSFLAHKSAGTLNQRQKRKRWRQCPHTRTIR